jgi:predicted nucleic acid-binding protein
LRKAGFETALETLNLFWVHERVKIINVDEQLFKRASEILMSFPGLSLTDASIAITMEKLGIRKLYSFDGGFDRIEWIERLEG